MSVKTERPQVRTAQDLERKYAALFGMETAIKQSQTGLIKVNNILNDFIAATIGDLETLQNQLDGQIDTWYGSYEPTLLNEPVSNWQVSEYNDHVGDLFYNNNTGATYQFTEDNGTYSWNQVESSLMSEILSMANAAKDTADNKRRVFVTQPVPPYDTGDLWLNNQELYICQIARQSGSYTSGDFIVATKYTDDTVALSAQDIAEQAEEKAVNLKAEHDKLQLNFDKRIILNDGSELATNPSTITFEDGAIVFAAGNSRVRIRIDNDSIDFQKVENGVSVTFASWSASDKSSSTTTLNLGDFQFKVREDNGSLDFNHI
jgi:hypothetical protein